MNQIDGLVHQISENDGVREIDNDRSKKYDKVIKE